ncbi:hypothetical protein ACIP93_29510 [Streptomyces sp. NPDC088745]|uniref:AMP-binding enzyme n=1 Tax=Streptomyces sp. NPDC088745 TaxID=3365884 RepID=UPI003825B33F
MQECAVFGVPAENGLGQRPVAVVRLRPGTAEPSADELREQGREELAAAGPTPSAAVLVAHDAAGFPTGVTRKVLERATRTRWAPLLTGAGRG